MGLNTNAQGVHRAQPSEIGYITFGASSLTVSVGTQLSQILSILTDYRTSGNGVVFDVPLTASATISAGAFTVTRPSTDGGASTFWYQVWGI